MAVRAEQAVAVKWPLDSPPLMLDPRTQGRPCLPSEWGRPEEVAWHGDSALLCLPSSG